MHHHVTRGIVQDAGGGTVTILVDRDQPTYPDEGASAVLVTTPPIGEHPVLEPHDHDDMLRHLVDEWGALGVALKLLAGVPEQDRGTWLRALAKPEAHRPGDLPRGWHVEFPPHVGAPVVHHHLQDEPCTPACPNGVLYVPADLTWDEQPAKAEGARMATRAEPLMVDGVTCGGGMCSEGHTFRDGCLLHDADTAEAVWSLRRIYDELAWRSTDYATTKALDMLRWHVEYGEADPGPVAGDTVVDAVVEGEFTDAQAAMVVALVAVCRATHDGAQPVSAPGYVRKAADVVRMARGSTPGWDEADVLIAIETVTR